MLSQPKPIKLFEECVLPLANRAPSWARWALLLGLSLLWPARGNAADADIRVEVLWEFGPSEKDAHGSRWPGPVLLGSDGHLYGTTLLGGAHDSGTIYRWEAGSGLVTVHSFGEDDGAVPMTGMTEGFDRRLYGMTAEGGANGSGTLVAWDEQTGFRILHSFSRSESAFVGDSEVPFLLQGGDGNLYGARCLYESGPDEECSLFSFSVEHGLETLHSFPNVPTFFESDWISGLIEGSDGGLYGTKGLGESGGGTIFRWDRASGLTVLHTFAGGDGGAHPSAGLLEAEDGRLYGTTFEGGASGLGTIFCWDPAAGLTTLHSFDA